MGSDVHAVHLARRAQGDLLKMPKRDARRIRAALYDLAAEENPHTCVKKLKGHEDAPIYSCRIGNYRAEYLEGYVSLLKNNGKKLFLTRHGLRATQDANPPGPHKFLDAELAEQGLEGLDLLCVADDLQDHGFGADVHDLGPEDGGDLHDLGPGLTLFRGHLEHGQLPFHPLAVG